MNSLKSRYRLNFREATIKTQALRPQSRNNVFLRAKIDEYLVTKWAMGITRLLTDGQGFPDE
jgi:hypothetical protein